jgi:hypothetical protein
MNTCFRALLVVISCRSDEFLMRCVVVLLTMVLINNFLNYIPERHDGIARALTENTVGAM